MDISVELEQIIAFGKRDFHSWKTYRTAVVTQLISIFIGVFSWGVGAAYVQKPVQEMYHCDYISFLLVGVMISNLILPLVQGVERQLNPWTLETILMTGIRIPTFVIGNIAWSYTFSAITFIPHLLIGFYVFNIKLNANLIAVALSFVISAAILLGLAMISTGLRIVIKSTDPVTWMINVLQSLFSGVAFPVLYLDTIFFPGVSTFSWFLPQTWVYHLCRLSMLTNPSLLDTGVLLQFLMGALFGIILLPFGYKVFQWGLNRSKREGTLGWY